MGNIVEVSMNKEDRIQVALGTKVQCAFCVNVDVKVNMTSSYYYMNLGHLKKDGHCRSGYSYICNKHGTAVSKNVK